VEDFAARFAERGHLAIDRLFEPALIAAIHDEYRRQFGDLDVDRLPPHLEVGDRRVQMPIELSGPLLDPMLTANPLLLRMVETILDLDPLIDSFTCVTAFPGAKDQRVHADHPQLFPSEPGAAALPCFALTVAVPLIDLTPETGSTRVFPGTHLRWPEPGTKPGPGEGEIGYARRGGCYFMDYRLWHHGTANRSEEPRPVLYIIYARPWFTDLKNFSTHARLRLSREDALAMPLRQRRLFRRIAAKGELDMTEAELLAS